MTQNGASSVALSAAGTVNLASSAYVDTDGVVGISGANISLNDAYAYGDLGVVVNAVGNLDLTNYSGLYGGGTVSITTGGNVTVNDVSTIYGYPDVVMKVGGVIGMNNDGKIIASSPTTIYLTFPMLERGGFFVNGIEGVVFDGNTGFFADGSGAILGQNLLVTYGGAPVLNIPTNTLIVAMGESVTPPDPERDKDVFEDERTPRRKKKPSLAAKGCSAKPRCGHIGVFSFHHR